MTGASPALVCRPRSGRRRRLRRQGAAGRRASMPRRASATPSSWRGISAARRASRITTCAMSAEADEAVQDAFVKAYSAPRLVSRGAAVRRVVHAHPDQRMPGPDQGADAPGALAGADVATDAGRATAARRAGHRRSGSPAAARRRRRRCSVASGASRSPRRCAKLPERQRSVFVLSHVEGRTSREVSALTGLNESTVRVHLFRAIRKLRALLAHDGAARRGN